MIRAHPYTSFLVESYTTDPEALISSLPIDSSATDAGSVDTRDTTVHYRGSIAVPGDELAFHLFDAVDAEAVADVCDRAGIRCDRIVAAIPYPR